MCWNEWLSMCGASYASVCMVTHTLLPERCANNLLKLRAMPLSDLIVSQN